MASQQFIMHVTMTGERWDLLSWRYYGDPTLYGPIIMANLGIPIEPVFEAGLVIAIPILQKISLLSGDLPPWKRIAARAA